MIPLLPSPLTIRPQVRIFRNISDIGDKGSPTPFEKGHHRQCNQPQAGGKNQSCSDSALPSNRCVSITTLGEGDLFGEDCLQGTALDENNSLTSYKAVAASEEVELLFMQASKALSCLRSVADEVNMSHCHSRIARSGGELVRV